MVSCISYTTQTFSVSVGRADEVLTRDISLSADDRQIDEVAVVARKNLEAEQTLMMERRQASAAIENIGAREMAVKGVGNVDDGVSKLTGISIAQAGQLIVRGLGDRYSTTSLNGLPIPSPNPDNKLIPLDIFPTSTVSNITVSKVYEADYYVDYSGAHVDIGTRESTGADFVNLQVGVGGNVGTLGADFYSMDRKGTFWGQNRLKDRVTAISKSEFESYVRTTDVFGTTFDVSRQTARPDLSLGLRFEHSEQAVDYSTDGGHTMTARLKCDDIFPAVNIKYAVSHASSLRLSLSRTVTRPSFIEMAPFLYQESYGAAQIRGNADLDNGYNIDLRFERITNAGDLLAATAYCKLLHDPIERIQRLSGGSAVHSFYNADNGRAAGIELEARRKLSAQWQAGFNASLMYTNVKLPEGGSYTNDQRALQGAAPYLGNADVTWHPTFADGSGLTMALLYNLQGPRIHAVGIAGLGDV